jgi:hypothetical protein
MQIYVHQNNQQLGPYTEVELSAQLAAGTVTRQDLVWWEGQPGWVSLEQSSLAGLLTPAPSSVALPAPPQPVVAPVTSASPERTSSLAIGALVSGIMTFFLVIPFIVAIILGHMSLAEIRRNPGLKGRGMALTGLILGYSVPAVFLVVFIIAFSLMAVLGNQVKNTFKTINAQMAAAESESADTNSTASPATNSAPDSTTNAAPQPSGQ